MHSVICFPSRVVRKETTDPTGCFPKASAAVNEPLYDLHRIAKKNVESCKRNTQSLGRRRHENECKNQAGFTYCMGLKQKKKEKEQK